MIKLFKITVISLLLLLGLISCDSNPNYEDYNTHKPMNVSVRGNSTETLEKVQKLFNEQNYEQANVHLARLAGYYTNNLDIQFYYGITFLETDQFPIAKTIFNKILLSKNVELINDSKWYLALMALKQNDLKTCKLFLEQIPKDANNYKQVKSLLKKVS